MTSAPGPRPYPLSEHCDGKIFSNPGGIGPPGLRQVIKWQRTKQPARWPKQVAIPPAPPLAAVPRGKLAATWINHASVLLRSADVSMLIDPVFGERCGLFGIVGPRRVHPPGIPLETLPKIDAVLVSHDHYDHCDLPTLRKLVNRGASLAITPLGNWSLMKRAGFPHIVELDWWETYQFNHSTRVTLTPSQHWSNRLRGRRCGRLWGGFSIELEGKRVHFVGDTGYHPTMFGTIRERLGAPDLAFVPIGAYEPRWFMKGQHCNPAESVQIHQELGAKQSVAIHWGTFQLTDEGREEPVTALAEALSANRVPAGDFLALSPGESVVV